MRKTFCIIVLFLSLIGVTSKAQVSGPLGNYRTKGFTLTAQGGFPSFASATFGWQMGPHFNMGVKSQFALPMSGISMRYYIRDRKISPLVEADVSVVPSLMAGVALGKFEITGGIALALADIDYDINLGIVQFSGSMTGSPAIWPTINISYTFSFRKW